MLNPSLLFFFIPSEMSTERSVSAFAFWGWINDTNVSELVSAPVCDCTSVEQTARAETSRSKRVNKVPHKWWLSLLWKVMYCLWKTHSVRLHTPPHTHKDKRGFPLLHRLAEILHCPRDKGGKESAGRGARSIKIITIVLLEKKTSGKS